MASIKQALIGNISWGCTGKVHFSRSGNVSRALITWKARKDCRLVNGVIFKTELNRNRVVLGVNRID